MITSRRTDRGSAHEREADSHLLRSAHHGIVDHAVEPYRREQQRQRARVGTGDQKQHPDHRHQQHGRECERLVRERMNRNVQRWNGDQPSAFMKTDSLLGFCRRDIALGPPRPEAKASDGK
jgi:hypothetical protein